MTEIGLASVVAGISNTLGLFALVFCILKKYYGWIFLLLSQSLWLAYTIHADKIDVVSILLILISGIALYFWRLTDFAYALKKERIIIILATLGGFIFCFFPPLPATLPPNNEIVFQILVTVSLISLAFKIVDGWLWAIAANCFAWQPAVSDTFCVIIGGICVYGYAFYNWKKEVTSYYPRTEEN